jgi:ribosomal-protein-alanine N-acetyltransferase
MKPPPTFETARLLLRPPTLDDAEPIFQGYAQDPTVSKYLVWRPHQDIDTTRSFLERCAHFWRDETAFPWVIIRAEDGALLGMVELRIEGPRADLGYGLARRFWGNGYATEAVTVIVQWALAQESIQRVWATCDVENQASARVLEKAGMQREGILRRYIVHPNISDEPRDCFCYAVVK